MTTQTSSSGQPGQHEEQERAVGEAMPVAAAPAAVGEREPGAPQILKVSTSSRPAALAGAIANVIRAHNIAELQSIGAGATNQAIKAIAIARAYLAEDSIDIVFQPSFVDLEIGGEERTGIRLIVERR